MDDCSDIALTLNGAIESLQSREPGLTPLEKLKLKALRLNLHIVQGGSAEPVEIGAFSPRPASEDVTMVSLEARLSRLEAYGRATRAETRFLIGQARSHIAQGKALCDDIRRAIERNRLDCRRLSHAEARLSKDCDVSAFAAN